MDEVVSIPSAGLQLYGVVSIPAGIEPGARRAAFLVLHGFGGNSDSAGVLQPTRVLNEFGYVTLRFDMRGCGKSEGEFGRVICLEQVEDLGNALVFLGRHPAVDPDRIGVIGSSFGGAVAVYAGGTNPRIAAVDFQRRLGPRRTQISRPASDAGSLGEIHRYARSEGRAHRARTGKSLMVPRDDIVPIPGHVRENLEQTKCRRCWRPTRSRCFRPRPRKACSIFAPRRWSARSRRGRSCLSTPPTIR